MAVIPVSLRVPIRGRDYVHHWPALFETIKGDIRTIEDDGYVPDSISRVKDEDDKIKIVMPSGTIVPVVYDAFKNTYQIEEES